MLRLLEWATIEFLWCLVALWLIVEHLKLKWLKICLVFDILVLEDIHSYHFDAST